MMGGREAESIIQYQYLPEDVLHQILSRLDDIHRLKSMSLVCKQFCSLSSPLVHKLTLKNSTLTYSDFKRLFKRFSGVKKICIKFPNIDKALMAISNSRLNLEKLKLQDMNFEYPKPRTIENMSKSRIITSIEYLQLNWFHRLSEQLVIQFANLFPSLTEFIFTNSILWNDEQIHQLTSKHPNLRKIDLRFNYKVTDKTLDILSSNCPRLNSVNFHGCHQFSSAMYIFFFNNPQLSSVVMPDFYRYSIFEVSKVVQGMQVLQNLNHLSLEFDTVQDVVLIGLAELQAPLKCLKIRYLRSKKYTMEGLSKLLYVCTDLERLDIHLPDRESCNTYEHGCEGTSLLKEDQVIVSSCCFPSNFVLVGT